MAKLSYYAFDVGMVTLGIAFILFVVHTTILAAGRRVTARTGQLATAGGPGVASMTSTESVPTSTPAGGTAQAFVWASFVLVGIGLIVRAILVGRGPWGNLYEFSIAFAF